MKQFQPVRFGKYLLLQKIAAGGMAELFQAKIISVGGFEKLVAIKKILPHLSEDMNLVRMFINEAKLAAMITHQNVVQIYDLGSMEGAYFIAMEYIHGKDLRQIISKSRKENLPLPPAYALYITGRICAGLDYSHNLRDFQGNPLKLIHRDISPANILVSYEGEVKIVDFGIAKAAAKSSDTRVGIIKGKVGYMSPEQAAAKPVDHRSDIFSTGILLYEMLTGKRMFQGTDLEVLDRVRQADFEPAEMIIADLPPRVYEILHRALAREPELRYQSAAAMLDDLEDCLSQFAVRPSAELLGRYMKQLFAEEIASEITAIHDAESRIIPLVPQTAARETTITEEALEKEEIASRPRPATAARLLKLWLGAGLAAMIIAIAFASLIQKSPGPRPVQHPAPVPPRPSAVTPLKKAPPPPSLPPAQRALSTPEAARSLVAQKTRKPQLRQVSRRQQAIRALNNKQYALAVKLFEQMTIDDPAVLAKAAPAYVQALQGRAAAVLGTRPAEAEALLRKAARIAPRNPRTFFSLGRTYTLVKDYPAAIRAYRRAIRLDPLFPDAFFNLGFVYTKTHNYARAEAMFARVISLRPAYVDQAYFNLAMVQSKLGKKQQSLKNLEKALAINPHNTRAKKYLRRLKQESGRIR